MLFCHLCLDDSINKQAHRLLRNDVHGGVSLLTGAAFVSCLEHACHAA